MAKFAFKTATYTTDMQKITGGFLLKDILDRSAAKTDGTLNPNLSVYAYSSHDITITNLLYTLGVADVSDIIFSKFLLYVLPNVFIARPVQVDIVDYAACLLIELKLIDHIPHIEIFYKKSYNTDEASPIEIRNCGYSCPLDRAYELYDNVLPKNDYYTECHRNV